MGRLSRRAVFLDRDGTLNVRPPEHEYVTSRQEFVWLPGAPEGVARLARAGYVLAVVSNQRGVARGLVTTRLLCAIEGKIQRDLAVHDCAIDAFRYCLHDDGDGCDCRKPKPGMIIQVGRELDLDLGSSWMIGDSESDVRAGKAAGCKTALVGHTDARTAADVVAPSLARASEVIALRTDQPSFDGVADSNSSTSA
jgi:D-glycero-D-manno-heptose 1,7-bisphosphate phosphatase